MIDLTLISGGWWIGLDPETGILYEESSEYPYNKFPVAKVIGWKLSEAIKHAKTLNYLYDHSDDYKNNDELRWKHEQEIRDNLMDCINYKYYDEEED